jgi:lipid-A-disaccharide synthase
MSSTDPASATAAPGERRGEVEIFLVAVEESGDRLGGALMRALKERASVPLRFTGVGGREMAAAGLTSLLPVEDFSIIGFSAIPRRLPRILSHM